MLNGTGNSQCDIKFWAYRSSCLTDLMHALNKALRKALQGSYPQLADIHLSDYKVRILDSESGTEAITRVLIDTKNGDSSRWSTVGASTNIIEASWLALADAMEYALQKE